MKMHKHLLAIACAAFSCSVLAQWQWLDETGRKVFSDRAPPAHIPSHQILHRPGGKPVTDVTREQPSGPPSAEPAAQPGSVAAAQGKPDQSPGPAADAAREQAREEARRKAQEAEQKKRQAQQARLRQENCQRAKGMQASLQSGAVHGYINEKGERALMTEQRRQTELQHVQQLIRTHCK